MVILPALILLIEYLRLIPVAVKAEEDCPTTFPLKVNGKCYVIQTDGMKFGDARDMCMRLGGTMTSVWTPELLETVEEKIYNFITSKLENAKFWIGLVMSDRSMSKPKEDRTWEWVYDESQFVQKDYKLWESEGGPKEAGLTCAAVDGANDFMVKPLDCGGSRLPIICMMKKGKTCKHDAAPYLTYGEHCVAVLTYADAYGKVAPGCQPEAPTQYLEEMKTAVTMAAKNSFLGGGVYMYMAKLGDRFVDMSNGKEPDPDQWEEGEPRDQYDCVGLSLQTDNKMKLKTIKCDYPAAYMCVSGNST